MSSRTVDCPRCAVGQDRDCAACKGTGKILAPTVKQQQVLDMMAAGNAWPATAAFVFDTTAGAIISRHGLVRRGWLEHCGPLRGFMLTREGRALAKKGKR